MNKTMEELTLNQFNKKYDKKSSDWDFKAFKIVCVKCGSDKVEYNGKMETKYGYYGDFDVTHYLIVKCHDCGNALAMSNTQGGSGGYCNHD